MRNPANKQRGFTLVELLVVILMIVALAALVFSVTARMRKSAEKSVTLSNMRQIGTAMLAYNADQGRFPDQTGVAADGSVVGTWDRILIPFLGNSEVLPGGTLRPSVSGELEAIVGIFATPEDKVGRPPDTFKRSFTLPSWSSNYQAPGSTQAPRFPGLPPRKGIPFVAISAPERAAILVQWYTAANTVGQSAHAYGGIGLPVNLLRPSQQVLFADGHIEAIPAYMSSTDFRAKYWPLPRG